MLDLRISKTDRTDSQKTNNKWPFTWNKRLKTNLRSSLFCNLIHAKKKKRYRRTHSVLDLGPVGWIIMSLSALFFKFSQFYWCVNISKRRGTLHTAQMNKGLKDIQPKGCLNPAGPGSFIPPEWAALIRQKQLTCGEQPFDTAVHSNTEYVLEQKRSGRPVME